ncbi:hypothetical protein [Salmonella phage PS3-1]|nr:hypothetical protein [Salmonella phage PS3-1]
MRAIQKVKRFSFKKWDANYYHSHLRMEVRNTVI